MDPKAEYGQVMAQMGQTSLFLQAIDIGTLWPAPSKTRRIEGGAGSANGGILGPQLDHHNRNSEFARRSEGRRFGKRVKKVGGRYLHKADLQSTLIAHQYLYHISFLSALYLGFPVATSSPDDGHKSRANENPGRYSLNVECRH